MEVKLCSFNKDDIRLINMAARICYSNEDPFDEYENRSNRSILKTIMESHHNSIFEHITFTFIIKDISRALSHQLVRHRLASYHQRSQRYIKSDIGVVNPCIGDAADVFDEAVSIAEKYYNKLLEMGVSKENARYILPEGSKTHLLMTINGRSLIHILRLRCCNRAMPEFRMLADKMLECCRAVYPELFNNVGPGCYMDGKCPEGKMTCGKMASVIEKYCGGKLCNSNVLE